MYKNNDRIYAEAGKYLRSDNYFGTSVPCNDSNIKEYDITFSDAKIVIKNGQIYVICTGNNIIYSVPREKTFTSLYESLKTGRYSDEEKLNIILNKNNSDEDSLLYSKMIEWFEWVEVAAKNIAMCAGIEVEETVDSLKIELIKAINKYDNSSEVNSFYYKGQPIWLDKATRVGLMNSTAILKNQGMEETTLWLGDMSVTIPCDTAIYMLSMIEMYALQCYNVTAEHKAQVHRMRSVNSLKNFDYKAGYPEKLSF